MTAILKEAVRAQVEQFNEIKFTLFTTFTFAPDFFEKNILPLIFKIEPGTDARVKFQVNARLSKIPVAVFYDGSMRAEGGRNYRYQVRPVSIRGRWFHPKNIIIAGEIDGEKYILVSAASANINLTAWGNNEESFGFLWIKNQSQKSWKALKKFCIYLRDTHGGEDVTALNGIIDYLQSMPGGFVRDKDDAELYFSSIMSSARSGFPEFLNQDATNSRALLRVFSPYWAGDIPELVKRFKAEKNQLVPAFKLPKGDADDSDGHYGLAAKQLETFNNYKNSLADPELLSLIKIPTSGDTYRFRHAKAYVLTSKTADKARVGVGSCNFTSPGLKGRDGNVESMIVYTVTERQADELLKRGGNLDPRDFVNTPGPHEGPPVQPPFEISVSLDWKKKEYSIDFKWHGDYIPKLCTLKLPGVANIVTLPLTKSVFALPLHNSENMQRTFCIDYTDDKTGGPTRFKGLIFEINLLCSQRDYLPRLSIFEIFESWMHHDDHIIERKAAEAEESGEDILVLSPAQNATPADLGFYDIYRVFFNIGRKLRDDDSQTNLDYIFTARPDSLYKLIEGLEAAPFDLATKFIILKECRILLKRVGTYKPDPSFRILLNTKFAAARTALIAELASNPQDMERLGGRTANEAVVWIEKRLEEAWENETETILQ